MGPLILIVYLFVIAALGLQFGLMSWWIRLPSEPVAKPHFGPNPRFCRMDSVSPQVAYSQQDMSTCGWTEPGPKSSNLCKKASFATGSLDWKQISGLAGFWVLMEWSRLFLLTGFTWNPSGLSLAANSHSIQFASLFGIYGLCFWIMWVNLFALRAFLEPKNRGKWIVWAAFAILPYFYGALQKSAVEPHLEKSEQTTVALVQTGIRPEQRDRLEFQMDAHIHPLLQWDRILSYMTATGSDHFDLIVFPEGALPGGAKRAGYSLEAARLVWQNHFGDGSEADFPPITMPFAKDGKATNAFWVQSLANHYDSEVIIGLDDWDLEANYNAAFHFAPKNLPIERYEKQILIPGPEYIPFSNWKWLVKFFAEKFGIEASFDPGQKAKVFSGAFPVGIFICLEETYSHLVREVRQSGARIFVNITNDVWFPKTRLPWHHFDHGRIRAAENGISLLRACNTGVTAAIDCFGEPIKIFPVSEESAGVLTVKFPIQSYSTLYTFLGDQPVILTSAAFFSFLVFGRLRKKKELP